MTTMRSTLNTVVVLLCLALLSVESRLQAAEGSRVTRDLQVLYTFEAGQGNLIQDRSEVGEPLNLNIKNPSEIKWQNGAVTVKGSARIQSTPLDHSR